jgi:hypothetical protein
MANATASRPDCIGVSLLCDHHDRGLDHGYCVVSHVERQVVDRLIGDGEMDRDAIADVDVNMARGLAVFDFGNPALDLIARAQLYHRIVLT